MKEYFLTKLSKIHSDIERTKDSIVKYARGLEIKELLVCVEHLRKYEDQQEQFTKDAVINLSVSDFIDLFKKDIVRKYAAEYAYKYDTKGISLSERDLLSKECGYGFKDAKIK
jgi:hypothetical protein